MMVPVLTNCSNISWFCFSKCYMRWKSLQLSANKFLSYWKFSKQTDTEKIYIINIIKYIQPKCWIIFSCMYILTTAKCGSLLQLLHVMGNENANSFWYKHPSEGASINSDTPMSIRIKHIVEKYAQKKFAHILQDGDKANADQVSNNVLF